MFDDIHKSYLAAAVGVLLTFGSGYTSAANCPGTADTSSEVLSNGFTLNLSSTRNNPSEIDSSNIDELELAYTHTAYKGEEPAHEKRGAPVVTETTIYTTSGFSVVAMDRKTGCEYWSYDLPATNTLVGGDGVRSIYYLNEGLPGKPPLIFAGDNDGFIHAIHAGTGEKVWSDFLGTDKRNHKITAHPQFFDGKLIIPYSSKEVLTAPLDFFIACCRSHGIVQTIDPYTGEVIWTYHTTPRARLQWNLRRQGPNGVPLWGSPTIDPERRTVYIGTGQNYTQPFTHNSDSIVALDLDTGEEKWVFQATHDDAFNASCSLPRFLQYSCSDPDNAPDLDFGAAPVLAERPDGKTMIFAGAKDGVLYAIDPDNGELAWKKRLGSGSNLGGIHWGLAVDESKVYAGVSDVIVNKISGLNSLDFGALTAANMALVENPTPGVYAVDMMNGDIIWHQHPVHEWKDPETGENYEIPDIFSAAVTVTNDILFAGSLNGVMYAYRTDDGEQLWSYDTAHEFVDVHQNPGNGGTIDQVGALPAGTDLLINSGYDHFGGRNAFQAGEGNGLFVFRLKNSL